MHRRTDDLPKALKREIQELAGVVHERWLAAELRKLDAEFGRWREGAIDAIELSTIIHKFHEGPPRLLWLKFNTNHVGDLAWYIREALADGTLAAAEVSVEALAFLGGK